MAHPSESAPPPRGWPILAAVGGAIVLVIGLVAWLVLREPAAPPVGATPVVRVEEPPPSSNEKPPVVTSSKRTRGVVRPTPVTTKPADDSVLGSPQ